jgi:pimeloyl-ACP methyl ester carboxylesterase
LGFGESSEPSGALHAAGQAEMLVALIRQELRRPVHVVGFDFGGPTAVLLYARAPELLASLTLAATNVFTDTDVPLPLRSVRLPLLGDLFGRLFFGRLGLSALWLNAVSRKDRLGFWRFREPLRFPRGVVWTRRIFQSSLRNLETLYAPVEATLPTFRIPCAVLWGGRDPFFPLAVGERTAASIPNARFVSFASCGHFLPEEEPEGVAAAISALVSEAETGTPPAAARRRVGAS